MALASATASATASSPSGAIRRLSPSAPPSSLLPLAARHGARNSPRACSYRRLVVRWKGRARALLGGFSDAGASESDDEDDDALRGGHREGEGDDEDAAEPAAAAAGPERWDVLGLGQAMVDFSGMVDDEFLERLGIEKGTRKVVNHEERGRVLRAMDGCSYKAAAGGSLSNSLVALARLGSSQSAGYPELKIAMAGSVGSDPLGSFYRAKLRRANVHFLSKPVKDGTTGTVIVLTTPDAQRTMLAYQGTSSTLNYDSDLADLVSKSNVLIVEGYLFELPHTIEAIKLACEDAHKNGSLIAVTASDVSCIKRCYNDFCPLFVTWKKATNGSEPRLRGCIGTLEPRQIVSGFKDYALTSALRDRRFPPIQSKELPTLVCTVSILTDYEAAEGYLDWEVGKHGLIIEFTDPDYNIRRSATYLPEVASHEGWGHVETIDTLMRKAGYNGAITESLRKKIRVTRYQSTLYTMHYGEYVAYVKKNRGAAPAINGVVNGFKPGH